MHAGVGEAAGSTARMIIHGVDRPTYHRNPGVGLNFSLVVRPRSPNLKREAALNRLEHNRPAECLLKPLDARVGFVYIKSKI